MPLGAKKGHIVTEETRKKISQTLKGRHVSPRTEFTSERMRGKNNPMYGKPSPFKGRHHTKEVREKISKSLRGRKPTPGSFKKGHVVPQEWREKISKSINENKSSINKLLYGNHEFWRRWKLPILQRDNFQCQNCGSKEDLEVHHDKETMAEIINRLYNSNLSKYENVKLIIDYHVNNKVSGITLCKKCHTKTHTYGGRNKKFLSLRKRG